MESVWRKLVCYMGKKQKKAIEKRQKKKRQLCGYAREGHKISTDRAIEV